MIFFVALKTWFQNPVHGLTTQRPPAGSETVSKK